MKNRNSIILLTVFITCSFILPKGMAGAGPALDFLVPESQEAGPPIILVFDPVPKPNWVAPPPELIGYALQTATITVNFLTAGSTQHGYTCQTWPANAQTAFNYAASIAGSLVNSSVPIEVNACWADLGGSGILGIGGSPNIFRNFPGAPQPNTWYSPALANALRGIDNDPAQPDIQTTYNSIRTDWYFGTDGNPGSKLDFVSVVLHEIWHGLNFSGSMRVTGGLGYWEWGNCGHPSSYDRFTEDGGGGSLLNYTCGSTSLASALLSNNIFFDGPNAKAVNGGSRVPLYAPNSWQQGSSYSHLAESYNGTANALMTYSIGYNEANHHPGPVGLCLLRDLGWAINGTCGNISSSKIYLPLILKSAVAGPTPGYWYSPADGTEFYVNPDQTSVLRFQITVELQGCGIYNIWKTVPVSITDNQFSFSGALYASGTFNSVKAAHGTAGLQSIGPICDHYWTGGPWDWSAAWQNSTQPSSLPADAAGYGLIKKAAPAVQGAYTAVPFH